MGFSNIQRKYDKNNNNSDQNNNDEDIMDIIIQLIMVFIFLAVIKSCS